MAAIPTLDVGAGRARLLTGMEIRLELLRDTEGLREAFEGYKSFTCAGQEGRRLSDLRRNK